MDKGHFLDHGAKQIQIDKDQYQDQSHKKWKLSR